MPKAVERAGWAVPIVAAKSAPAYAAPCTPRRRRTLAVVLHPIVPNKRQRVQPMGIICRALTFDSTEAMHFSRRPPEMTQPRRWTRA